MADQLIENVALEYVNPLSPLPLHPAMRSASVLVVVAVSVNVLPLNEPEVTGPEFVITM